MLVYKPKQHLTEKNGLNYLTNFEITHLKYSVYQANVIKEQFCVSCSRTKKANCGLVSSNDQSMQAHVN